MILPPGLTLQGVILVDQIRCLDWQARGFQFVEVAPSKVLAEVQAKLETLIF